MSSVDPEWGPPAGSPVPGAPPPGPQPHRPHRVAYVFAAVLPLALLIVLAVPLGLAWAWRTAGGPGPAGVPAPGNAQGAPGLGDPYYPGAGNSGYDALKYQISVSWDPAATRLTGTTVVSARATQRLESFYLDLGLPVSAVLVNGRPAEFDQDALELLVDPAAEIAAGAEFSVTVDYAGNPAELNDGVKPWVTTGAEWGAIGEPESSAWWYPANDHPSDPALMDVSVRVPAGMEAISVGRLESADAAREADFDTWHWVSRQPMATYLNFVTIGQYELRQGTADGLPFVYAVSEQLKPEDRRRAFAALATSTERVRVMEQMFGPYPFTEIGGVVPAHDLPFAGLENQGRPVYAAGAILNEGYAPTLINHELAHMWFGDNVTLRQWDDIFINEAYASWAQWAYVERTGGRKANDELDETFNRAAGEARFWRVTMIDPTRANLFSTVYSRGPMAVQAVRNTMGDEPFFRFTRAWAQAPGSRSLEDWMAAAQAASPVDLTTVFQAWIYSPTAPARTIENGFR